MAKAYQIIFSGHGNTVVGSFDSAFAHIAATVVPDKKENARLSATDDFPNLATEELSGSYKQRVRFAAEDFCESIEIVEHDLDAAPRMDTTVFCVDIINDFDPSYELQAALYRADSYDERDLVDISGELQDKVYGGVEFLRRDANDEYALARLRRIEDLMGGTRLLPEAGSAKEILDALPKLAREKFETMAAEAFPEEAPTVK